MKYFLFLLLSLFLYAKEEGIIHKEELDNFNSIKEKIYQQPFNNDYLEELISFSDKNKLDMLKNEAIISLYKIIFITSNSKEIKETAFNKIYNFLKEDPKNISDKKRAGLLENQQKFYKDKNFRKTFENLTFFRLSNNKESENELKTYLESNKRNFYPTDEKEVFFKILYYTYAGNLSEAEDALKQINSKITFQISLIKKEQESKKKEAEINKNNRFYKLSKTNLNQNILFIGYTTALASFLYEKLGNTQKSSEYRLMSKELLEDDNIFYFYLMNSLYSLYEEYDKSLEYLLYTKKLTNYSSINNELFTSYFLAAEYEYKKKNIEKAWLNSKEGILIGKKLDYDKYYKHVISLKKILKATSVSYANKLASEKDFEGAKQILRDSDFILKDVK